VCTRSPESHPYPGLHPQHSQQGKGGDSAPLLCSGETPRESCVQALQPSAQERHGPVGARPEDATTIIRGMGHLSYEGRLRELELFSLEKRRHQGDLIAAFQYLKGPARQLERDFLQGHVVIGQGAMALN